MSQHDSTTPPPSGTPGAPYGGPKSGFSGRGTTFFDWMRGLGVVRSDGWLGGVCAGVANRIGIDPLIVRGIVVVAAILGAPMLLIYAAAWALLPDRENRIHLQRLFEGEFQPAIVGIGVLALLSLLPWAPGIWWANGGFWNSPTFGDVIGRVIWTLVVLGLIAWLIAYSVRSGWGRDAWRTGNGSAGGSGAPGPGAWAAGAAGAGAGAAGAGAGFGSESAPSAASATTVSSTVSTPEATGTNGTTNAAGTTSTTDATGTDATAPTETLGAEPAATADAASTTPTLDVTAEPTEPPAPTGDASPRDVDDWRARHASWQAEHAQWKARLSADMRAVKNQRAAELRAQAAVAQAEAAAQRRAYRAANPRIGAAFGWATIGLALVAAALMSVVWEPVTGLPGYGVTAAIAAATFVFGVAALVAGLARRRSGFLIFLGILLAVVTLVSVWVPRDRQLIFDGAQVSPTGSSQFVQAYGDTTVHLDSALGSARGTPVVDLIKGPGGTRLEVADGVTVHVIATTASSLYVEGPNDQLTAHTCSPGDADRCTIDTTVGPGGDADAIVRIDQAGEIVVRQNDSARNGSGSNGSGADENEENAR